MRKISRPPPPPNPPSAPTPPFRFDHPSQPRALENRRGSPPIDPDLAALDWGTTESSTNSAAAALSSLHAGKPRRTNAVSVPIRQPYFRWLGPTAIAPPRQGSLRPLYASVTKDVRTSTSSAPTSVPDQLQALYVNLPANGSGGPVNFEPRITPIAPSATELPSVSAAFSYAPTRSPSPSVAPPANAFRRVPPFETIATFCDHLGSLLPYQSREELCARVVDGTISEVVLNAIGALAERISPTPGATGLGEQYADRAKQLLIPHLGLPSVELVWAMLLLAYHEFGEGRDSGLWQWSGLAIRMSIDLGLHIPFAGDEHDSSVLGDSEADVRSRVFWSAFVLDRTISCGTGRPTTIPLDQIETYSFPQIDLPPAREDIYTQKGVPLLDPFPSLCRLLVLVGQVSDALNAHLRSRGPTALSPSVDDNPALHEALRPFQQAVTDFHAFLHPSLQFTTHNFSAYATAKHSQSFITLSVWYQGLYLAAYHPSVLYPQGVRTPGDPNNSEANTRLCRSSAISISDMIAFADLIYPHSFVFSPFMTQPMLAAGRVSLTQMRNSPTEDPALQRSLEICQAGLYKMNQVWMGVSWVRVALDNLAGGKENSGLSEEEIVKIRTRDRGMLKRAQIDAATRDWLVTALGGEGRSFEDIATLGLSVVGVQASTESQGTISFMQTEPGLDASYSWGPPTQGQFSGEAEGGAFFKGMVAGEFSSEDVLGWMMPPVSRAGEA